MIIIIIMGEEKETIKIKLRKFDIFIYKIDNLKWNVLKSEWKIEK